jgi:hypothetical protein
MTLMTRIIADKPKKFGVNPRYPRHQRSITPYIDLMIVLSPGKSSPTENIGFVLFRLISAKSVFRYLTG